MLRRQQVKQLTWNLLCPLPPTICDLCSGVLNVGQKRKQTQILRHRNKGEIFLLTFFSFHWQPLAATAHGFGMSNVVPAHRLQVRQLFSQGCCHHKHVSPLQSSWYLFVLIMLNADNSIKQTNKTPYIINMFSKGGDLL